MPPTSASGKICYVEISATDPARSAAFYERVFGWRTRKRGDGNLAFDDTTGAVSGSWVTGRSPMTEVGLLVYIMVDDVTATLEKIVAHGGAIVQPACAGAPEVIARFQDPGGNMLGLYQEPPAPASREP